MDDRGSESQQHIHHRAHDQKKFKSCRVMPKTSTASKQNQILQSDQYTNNHCGK